MAGYNFVAIDQYGQHFWIKRHPRKELLEQLGRKHAAMMYCDRDVKYTLLGIESKTFHVGYVIAGLWLTVKGLEGNVFAKQVR